MDGPTIETTIVTNNNNHSAGTMEEEAYEPTYAEAFPPLCPEDGQNASLQVPASRWSNNNNDAVKNKMAVRSSVVTQVFTIPMEERKFLNETVFGDRKIQASTVSDIMSKHDVSIEMSVSKDQSLSVIVTGKADSVLRARKDLTQNLQQQCTMKVNIPKDHHRFIIGSKNKIREQIEMETATRIKMPRPEEPSDIIEITGTREGSERARIIIQLKSDELSKLAVVRLNVSKVYHPFISGPNNQTVRGLIERTGRDVKVGIPPSFVQSDEITISGEKEGVREVEAEIKKIYEHKLQTCKTVSVEVKKSQHKYILGPRNSNLAEILAETEVWVEVPSAENPSETITLRGEGDKLGPALTLVYSKANSIICKDMEVESWLHKYIIGPKGASIRLINQEYPKVHIEFVDGENKITLEGPPADVANAEKAIREKVDDLKARMQYAELNINPKFHKHIIGKQGANIARIRKETGVTIRIPPDESNSSVVRIEGAPEHVLNIKNELMEMAEKMENEKTTDITIDHNLHKLIIGAHGSKIKEIRDKFNQVQISFPDASQQSNVVQLKGQKNDVDKCYKHLQLLVAEVSENNYKEEVHIFKDFHRNIIGKGGAKIRKIREETDTKIDLPKENSTSDVIVVTGKKENVRKAKTLIEQIQKELANISDITIDIPFKLHQSLIGAKGKLIKSISDDCGGVLIRFPAENTQSNKVHLKGPKQDVEKASKLLKDLASEKNESGYTAEVRAKSVNHGFLIGRGGSAINKLKEQLEVRFSFASAKDADPDLITIIGKKEAVEKAKKELEAKIAGLENIAEIEVMVEQKYHKHFTLRRGEIVNQIVSECGGITISFPKPGSRSDRVVLKGATECVEAAKTRIEEIVKDLESQISIEVEIPQKYHGTIMGAKGSRIQDLTRDFNVNIKMPERRIEHDESENSTEGSDKVVNGDGVDHATNRPPSSDIILVSGKPENCEAAKQAMLDLIPVTEELEIPHEYHGQVIGQKGAFIRHIQDEFGVNVMVPPQNERRDVIRIVGPRKNLPGAREELEKKVKQIEDEKLDRELRSFKVEVSVPTEYHTQIIGRKGVVINKLRDQFEVNIKFPERGAGDEEHSDVIIIQGYEKNALEAKEAILAKVHELASMYVMEVDIDSKVHPRLIGTKGRAINKIMEDFKVDIRFSPTPENPDLVILSGKEDQVLDCRDHLLVLEEEYIQDMEERSDNRAGSKPTMESFFKKFNNPEQQQQQSKAPQKGFVVRDAPWCQQPQNPHHQQQQVFDNSLEDFPDLGPSAGPAGGNASAFSSSVWGPKFKKP